MATVLDYAKMSQAAYSEAGTAIPNNRTRMIWKRIRQQELAGFFAALYTSDDNKECVLSFRGTQLNDAFDIINDVQIAFNLPPVQATIAVEYTRGILATYPKLVLTGHSLGGALAILVASSLNLKAYTFNTPGVMNECIQFNVMQSFMNQNVSFGKMAQAVNACLANGNIQNYRISGDPVSSMLSGAQTGNTITLQSQNKNLGIGDKHSIDTMVKVLETGASLMH